MHDLSSFLAWGLSFDVYPLKRSQNAAETRFAPEQKQILFEDGCDYRLFMGSPHHPPPDKSIRKTPKFASNRVLTRPSVTELRPMLPQCNIWSSGGHRIVTIPISQMHSVCVVPEADILVFVLVSWVLREEEIKGFRMI